MPLGLGAGLSKSGIVTPGIVTSNLVLKHKYDAGAVVPVSDGAVLLNGTDEYIDLGSKANSGSTLTFSAWVYITDTGVHPIIRFGDALLQMGADTNISIYPDASDGRNNTTISSVKDQWAHICATIDGTSASTYLNGVYQKTTTGLASAMSTDSASSYIGRLSSNYLKGYVCNVGMWSSALTQAQIKSIMWKNYAGLSTSEKTNLVSWWNLDSTISEDYFTTSETDASPSTINGMVLDNNDITFTEVSVTNSDFTSGSGTSITGWTNTAANKWEISGSTMISPNGVSLIYQAVLTNNITHKAVVRAKNTIPGSTSRLKVYFGSNNNAQYELTDDFQEYVFHGYQDNDTSFFLYNETGAASTNVTIDWVKLYKYDGNVGVLV